MADPLASEARVRAAFLQPGAQAASRRSAAGGSGSIAGADWPGLDGPGVRHIAAAVLVPVVAHPAGPSVLLTRRSAHLHHHPGQISFPGGCVEADDSGPVATALRETEEEIGLHRRHVERLGELPDYLTGTGFRVTPVVSLVHPPFELRLDPFEVDEVFEVPLSHFLDPSNHQRHSTTIQGRLRHFHAMPYGQYFIWGATAGILMSLYQMLAGVDGAEAGEPGPGHSTTLAAS
ncbi:CoA pyrophosphatase [Thiohalocapsa marina]|uniref:CoA pyrophosphatase n=1 Tax=Thiohalocapsa marina TaxID=424902 RepID=A0A5M8FPZ4_9GAMM|nr:CoA pyrophosphatase [Thiohalocapsa marina]KAA6182922.1 CoA pyrophosphatase [Thiohalocapsa marina]